MTNEQPAQPSPVHAPVHELRLAITVKDYDAVVRFYRDVLGLPELERWGSDEEGHVLVLGAGRATLEILDEKHAAHVDEIEVGPGRRVAGPIRVALQVDDSVATAERMTAAGADQLAPVVVTPWNHQNVRIAAPGDLQLTLFTAMPEDD